LASITKSGNLTFPFSESPTSLGFKSKYKLLPKEKSNTHHKIIPNQNFEITWIDDKNHKINLNKKASNELILTDDHSCIYEGFTEKPLPLSAGIKFVNLREPDTSITVLGNFLGSKEYQVESCKTKTGVIKNEQVVYDIKEGVVKYLPRGRHTLTFPGSGIPSVELSVESGENYVLFLMSNEVVVEKAVEGNSLTVLVLVPQFLLISAAEAFLGVGGLEMAIQRAPARLPTIMVALWYSTISIGNVLKGIINAGFKIRSIYVSYLTWNCAWATILFLSTVHHALVHFFRFTKR